MRRYFKSHSQMDRRRTFESFFVALVMQLGISAWSNAAVSNLSPVGADAAVLVNSTSARYLDFQHYIQPYLDNFGVPYTVVDIATNRSVTNLAQFAVIIVGHAQLDMAGAYSTGPYLSAISAAVSNGSGLVNFDNALADTNGTPRYQFVQDIFGFGYTNSWAGTNLTLPATEPPALSQMHFITALHQPGELIVLSNSMNATGLKLQPETTALAVGGNGSNPFIAARKFGAGRAVQWGSYDWIAVAIKGPVAGMDDLVWRSIVWAARKPFVMRGLPNFVTMRVDDVGGPYGWTESATNMGFKPWMGLFISDVTSAVDIQTVHDMVASGRVTTSIHSYDCCNFFYWNHYATNNYPDSVMNSNLTWGAQWHQAHGIPISKIVALHYSEVGPNAFPGLKSWGVEFVTVKNDPGTPINAPWLVSGPYRYYENRLPGNSLHPVHYADFLNVPGHPELAGQFFNVVTEIRDDASCGEWCPGNDVTNSIGRGTRQLVRAFDSQVLATLFTHEWYIYPITGADSPAMTTSNNWIAIDRSITNNLAPYHPVYVTLDYGSQYVRATHTSHPISSSYDPASGQVTINMTGQTDMNITAQVYLGVDNSISNVALVIPQFTGQTNAAVTVTSVPLGISAQPQNVTVPAGSTATVGVAVTGNPPLTFQWEDNGTNIPNATNAFFTIGAAQFADAGAYSVLVSNATGSVLSSNAMLTVTPVQPPMLQGAVDQLSSHKMFVISFTSNPGQRYVVQYTDAPANGGWSVLTNVTATATNTVCHDPIIGWPQRFYRVLVAAVLPERVQLTGALQSGQFILAFNATTGKSYTVQYQDGLGAWTVLTNITAANTNVLLTNPIIGPQRLFQVSTPAH